MKIALIHDRVRWEEKELVKVAKALHIDLELINLDREQFNLDENVDYDVALQRSISYFRGLHTTAILENKGVKVYESFKTASVCGNKLLTTLALLKADIKSPETKIAFTSESALKTLDELGYPALLKPIYGSWGRLVATLNDPESAKSILENRDFMGALYSVFYLQKRIEKPRDIRSFVVGDQVVAAIYRYTQEGEWRANVALGSEVESCEITDELEDLSLKATKAVGGKIVSVDILESEKGLLVNEVNSTPEFRGLSSVSGVEIPKMILEFIKEEVKA